MMDMSEENKNEYIESIELVERCVLALTNEDDIVYDPFAGVGSSLIASLKNNRIAYGTEMIHMKYGNYLVLR